MASHARQQYFADWETLKKEAREFAMTDELKAKLDSIEWWAQVNVIEDVKVNWVSLEVVDKSVDVLVPLVIDNLYTVDWDNALSAKQWKILYDYIQSLQSRGRYLSNWNTATWLPSTNPSESPYEYRAGDYFVVSVTAATWGTNYRPDGSSYTIGVASTTVETEPVHITDIYLYDWTNWLLLTNSTREIPIDDALSTTSTNPVENRVVTNAINTKQDKLIAWNNIQIAQDGKTISATDTTYSAWTNVSIDANNVISAVDTTYSAWANINIDANNVISAKDTVYAEWTGIDITDNIISNEWVLTVNGNNWNVTVNDVKVSSTAPANPTEGLVWYDTTNDILKMYDGTNWNPVGENDRAIWWNITGTLSNQTDLQNALDAKQDKFFTKSAVAPSNPSEWDQWYDDTNNVMKFYDGTEWKKIDTDTDINAQWWNITGTLSNQTDLQTALDNKITKEGWNQIAPSSIWFWLYWEDEHSNNVDMQVSVDDIMIDAMAGMTSESAKLSLRDRTGINDYNPSLVLNHWTFDESLWTSDRRMVELDTDWVDFIDEFWNWQETITTNKSYTFDETSNGIVRFGDLNSIPDNLKSFYLPSDVTTPASLATAQAAYEYMSVGVPVLRMGSMYDTTPWTLTFFPVKKVNPGASWTMIFLSTQLSKATSGGYTMVFQDRVEFTVTNWQVTSITKQFTNSSSTLLRLLETDANYSSTYTPSFAWSPTNKKYVDKWDTAYSATAPTTDLYEGKLWYDKVNDVLKAYDGTNWNVTGKVYTAWTGINITNDVISCTLNPVTVSQTAPSNQESWDLWFNTTKQTLNLYNWTSWVLVGPEIVPITKAAYDLLSSADKNDWRFYLITDNDWTIYVEWANVQNAPISAGTAAPSSPNEWDIWYDTTNDILKVYDGTNWNWVWQWSWDVVWPNSATGWHVAVFDWATGKIIKDWWALPEESNIKAFPLSGTWSSDSVLAEAQAIYDWYAAGKVPFILLNNKVYAFTGISYGAWNIRYIKFADSNTGEYTTSTSKSSVRHKRMISVGYDESTWVVTTVNETSTWTSSSDYRILFTDTDYSTPYTPQYDGSPATKKYVDDNTKAVSWVSTTQPSNPVAGSTYYDTTNNVLMVYDGTSWNAAWKTYTAWNGIDITNDVISTDIVAWNWINITGGINCTTESDRRWPSPSGFHVPSITEWQWVETIMTSLSLTTWINWGTNLHMPLAGYRDYSPATISSQGSTGQYWSSSPNSAESNRICYLYLTSSRVSTTYSTYARAYSFSVRCFKNTYVTPDSSWTVVQWTLWSAWIFWNQTEWLISITDWTTWYTIQDKNLWATTVYSDWDTLTEANMGYMYQWWNNYWFPSTWTLSNTSSTQVDASNYWPTNPYSSDTYIIWSSDWSSVQNDDLWWDTSNSTHQECTWVTSTLTISSDTTSGSWAPATTPSYIWQQYVDTTNDLLYVATGTSSSSDWTLVGANTWVEVQVISQSDYDSLTEDEKTADVIYLITGWSGWLTVAWTNVTWKPDLIINPSGWTAWQLLAKTANGYEWTTVNSATWWNISGTLSNQTDLQTALDAKQDELNAWQGISIWTVQDYSAMRWPSPEGFHIPTNTEWQAIYDAGVSLWIFDSTDGTKISTYLKMPMAGYRRYNNLAFSQRGSYGEYWASVYNNTNTAYNFLIGSSIISPQGTANRSYGTSIRCLKDSPAVPTNSWTVLYQWTWSAWVFYNPTDWLISISSDWTTWYTLMDKNLWATVVYNYWDTMTEANCGKVYQWGNNYAFSWDADYDVSQITQSATQVDVTWYWPWNYYSSSTWITTNPRQSSANDWNNLWWWVTWVVAQDNTITNTGVLSVNWQTWNVTISSWWMQLAPNSPLTPTYHWYWTQSQYEALSQYYTEEEWDTVYYTIDW